MAGDLRMRRNRLLEQSYVAQYDYQPHRCKACGVAVRRLMEGESRLEGQRYSDCRCTKAWKEQADVLVL